MLKKMAMLMAMAVVSGGVMTGCAGNKAADGQAGEAMGAMKAEPVAIKSQMHGQQMKGGETGVKLVNSDAEWESLEIEGMKPNFGKESVVLLSLGEVPSGGYWARITGVQQVGDVVYVQGVVNQPAPGQVVTQAMESPYCVAVIEKVDANNVQYDVEEVMGEQPPVE